MRGRWREGWWLMMALCVACGLWFFILPLMSVGLHIGDWVVRPAWLGIAPCIFGVIYAAHQTRYSKLGAGLTGVALFIATLVGGVDFHVRTAINSAACVSDVSWAACENLIERPDAYPHSWERLNYLRPPLSPHTFAERVDRTVEPPPGSRYCLVD